MKLAIFNKGPARSRELYKVNLARWTMTCVRLHNPRKIAAPHLNAAPRLLTLIKNSLEKFCAQRARFIRRMCAWMCECRHKRSNLENILQIGPCCYLNIQQFKINFGRFINHPVFLSYPKKTRFRPDRNLSTESNRVKGGRWCLLVWLTYDNYVQIDDIFVGDFYVVVWKN